MYVVVAQRQIDADPERVWAFVSEPGKLARWFADAESFGPGEPVHFAFGDGDFFEGEVVGWQPGLHYTLNWRFLGLGPRYEVRLSLLRRKRGTEVSIQDMGALTVEEAECLRVGWSEFLMRLDSAILHDADARFSWRRAITFTAALGPADAAEGLPAALRAPAWYDDVFAGARLSGVEPGPPETLRAALSHPAWHGQSTRLLIERKPIDGADYLFFTHDGWERLGAELGPVQRLAAVTNWRVALPPLGLS